MTLADEYFAEISRRLDEARRATDAASARAVEAIVGAARRDGRVYVFGTGHSHVMAEEAHYRAGGLAVTIPVLAGPIMVHEGAVAGFGKDAGATVIALTSIAYSTALAAGVGPDIMFVTPDFVPILKQVKDIPSVGDLVAEQVARHDFIDSAVEAYSYQDGVWAVPLYNMAMNLWYRKGDLAEAGIDVPRSWADPRAAAEALSTDGAYGLGLPANKQLYTDQTVYSFMVNGGASEIYDADGTPRFDTPETVEIYTTYANLQEFSPPDSTSWTWGEAEACFIAESCGMILQFSVITGYDAQGAGDPADLGVAPVPTATGYAESQTIAYANAGLILSDSAAERAAAEAFLAFLLEPENCGRFLNMEPGLFMPLTATGAAAESFWTEPLTAKYRGQIEGIIANARNGRPFGFTSGRAFPLIAAISARNLIAETLQDIVVRGTAPAEALIAGQALMVEAAAD